MPVDLYPDNERMTMSIRGALTIMEAAEAREQLALGLTKASGPIVVNLAQITEIDASGLQLLIALARIPRDITLIDPSPALSERIERFNLRSALRIKGGHRGS